MYLLHSLESKSISGEQGSSSALSNSSDTQKGDHTLPYADMYIFRGPKSAPVINQADTALVPNKINDPSTSYIADPIINVTDKAFSSTAITETLPKGVDALGEPISSSAETTKRKRGSSSKSAANRPLFQRRATRNSLQLEQIIEDLLSKDEFDPIKLQKAALPLGISPYNTGVQGQSDYFDDEEEEEFENGCEPRAPHIELFDDDSSVLTRTRRKKHDDSQFGAHNTRRQEMKIMSSISLSGVNWTPSPEFLELERNAQVCWKHIRCVDEPAFTKFTENASKLGQGTKKVKLSKNLKKDAQLNEASKTNELDEESGIGQEYIFPTSISNAIDGAIVAGGLGRNMVAQTTPSIGSCKAEIIGEDINCELDEGNGPDHYKKLGRSCQRFRIPHAPLEWEDDNMFTLRERALKEYVSIVDEENEEKIIEDPCSCDPTSVDPCGDNTCELRVCLTECSKNCQAGLRCMNRRISRKQFCKTRLGKTENRGWGLFLTENVEKDQLVAEYCGEIIDKKESTRRMQIAFRIRDPNFYFFHIKSNTILDAGPAGSFARFINHSCDPNCETQKWSIDGETRVGIFTKYPLPKGTEVTYNYFFSSQVEEGVEEQKVVCKCGAVICPGFMGARPLKPGEILRPPSQTRTDLQSETQIETRAKQSSSTNTASTRRRKPNSKIKEESFPDASLAGATEKTSKGSLRKQSRKHPSRSKKVPAVLVEDDAFFSTGQE